jgi:hypothetical protein
MSSSVRVRELVEDLLMAQAVRQEVQHVDDADAYSGCRAGRRTARGRR